MKSKKKNVFLYQGTKDKSTENNQYVLTGDITCKEPFLDACNNK